MKTSTAKKLKDGAALNVKSLTARTKENP